MANYPEWYAEMTLVDGVGRTSVVSARVPEATAKLYFAAADKAARDATAIGVHFSKLLEVTLCEEQSRRVYVIDKTAPVGAIDDSVLRGNKIVVGFQSGAGNYTFTLPGRDATAYTQKTDEPEIDISAAGDFKTFYESFETVCLGPTGLSADVTKAYLND
jgi:hypothetical protein